MKEVLSGKILLYNPETGQHDTVDVLRGESAYEAAVRLGYTTLSESEWVKEYDNKRDQAIAAIVDQGKKTLAEIPEDYITVNNNLAALSQENDGFRERFENLNIEGRVYKETYVDDIEAFTKTAGYYWADHNAAVESEPWNYHSKNVAYGEKYRIRTYTVSMGRAYYFIDSSGNIIQMVPQDPSNSVMYDGIATVPIGAVTMIVNSCPVAGTTVIEKFNKSEYQSDGVLENKVKKNTEDIANVKSGSATVATMENVLHEATKIEGYLWAEYDGPFEVGTWNYYRKNVYQGETYHVNAYTGNSASACVIFDGQGQRIAHYPESLPETNTAFSGEIIIPTNGAVMIVNELASVPASIGKKVEYAYFRAKNVLTGKMLAVCGDSITAASNPDGGYFKNYGELVAERNGMTFYKDGIGGSTMANVEGHKPFSANRYLNVPEYDYLLLWFGWNDGAYSELGTIEDTDNATFYGAYKMVLNYFITTYPTKKIGLIVPYMSNKNYQQAVRDVSSMYGVPCLDLPNGNECSLIWGAGNEAQLARRAALTYDTTHPNQAGYEYLSTMVEAFLKRL